MSAPTPAPWGDAIAAAFQERLNEAIAEGAQLRARGASDDRIDANLDRQRALLHGRIRIELMQDRRALLAENERLLSLMQHLLPFCRPSRDHACAECMPGGEIVLPGFRCRYHSAVVALEGRTIPCGGAR